MLMISMAMPEAGRAISEAEAVMFRFAASFGLRYPGIYKKTDTLEVPPYAHPA
jgi:hypothetical protein